MRSGSNAVVRVGSRRLGADATLSSINFARAEQDMGALVTGMTLKQQLSSAACSQGSTYGYSGTKAWVDRGCRGVFDIQTGTFPDYAKVDSLIQTLIQKIQSCMVSPNVAVPSSWMLPPPPSTAPSSVRAAYDSYSLRLNSELPEARQNASALCTTAGASPAPDPSAPGGSGQTCGTDYWGRPIPCGAIRPPPGSAIIPDQGNPYGQDAGGGYDIYTPSPSTGGTQRISPDGGGTIIENPFAPKQATDPAPKPPRKARAAVMAGSGVLMLVAAVVMLRKRRRSR